MIEEEKKGAHPLGDGAIGLELRNLRKIAFLTHGWTGITSSLRTGGPLAGTASVFKLWERCQAHGLEVHVIVLEPQLDDGPRHFTALGGVHFHYVEMFSHRPIESLSGSGLKGFAYPLKLVDWYRALAMARTMIPDADLYYSMRYSLGIPVLALARLAGARAVARYYGTWLYEQLNSNRILDWVAAIPAAATMKLPFDLLIMTNDGTRGDWVFSKLGVPKEKWRFWLNGSRTDMHIEHFDQRQGKANLGRGIDADSYLLLCVGRLSAWKRQDILIRALPEIVALNPRAKLLLVGTGEAQKEYESLAKSLDVSEHVIFYGSVANDDLAPILNSCDVYFQVNDISNVSTTLIEALSAGCCCVVRDEGDMKTIVNDSTALLLKSDDPGELAAQVADLMSHPEMRAEYASRAQDDSRTRFKSWDDRMDLELAELERLVSSHRSDPGV